ncbi:MAG: class I tRNA ligase family protein [bacterium]
MKNKFYITTPIYYANGSPHLGHAYTTVAADVLARFHHREGKKVFLSTGMDEHGAKIQKTAEKAGKNPQEFVDGICGEFKELFSRLNIKYDGFIRTTDKNHIKAVQNALQSLFDKGVIYKGVYKGLYCVGCEQFLMESQLIDGKCPDHNIKPEMCEEESYLLKMEEIKNQLIKKIEKDEFEISPLKRKNEALSFLSGQDLQDVAISRDKKKVSWGVGLPFDGKHIAYVWVDAFLNYLTVLGWDGSVENIPDFFPPDIQLVGKDILRVHFTIWPAILLHLEIDLPKEIFAHGMIISGGKKMSKTLGNVVSPNEMIDKFGVDATRYLLMTAGRFSNDVDIAIERMIKKYNAELVNGIGNASARVTKMAEGICFSGKNAKEIIVPENIRKEIFENCLAAVDFQKEDFRDIVSFLAEKGKDFLKIKKDFTIYIDFVIRIQWLVDKMIAKEEPWKFEPKDKEPFILNCLEAIRIMAQMLYPFMPDTAEKIFEKLGLDAKAELSKTFDDAVEWGSVEFKNVCKGESLFPRIK